MKVLVVQERAEMAHIRAALPDAELALACFPSWGLRKAAEWRPDVVLLGSRLSGNETAPLVPRFLQHARRVIVVSRAANQFEAARALDAGAFTYSVIGGDGGLLRRAVKAAARRRPPILGLVPLQ
jgi:DNA-binding response OmpR family regulator